MSFIIAANWKMNKGPQETLAFFSEFKKFKKIKNTKTLFFVPSVNAFFTNQELEKSNHSWGPQNIYPQGSGAFTGETSPEVMMNLGAQYCLIGHSERRTLFKESDEDTNLKIIGAQKYKLSPVLCVGETLNERKSGHTLEVLKRQILSGLLNINILNELHIAYEPVWAIGTGEVASLEQVAQAHQFIRKLLNEKYLEQSVKIKILYGGSVKPNNSRELALIEDVGGFLVGGAALEPESFYNIAQSSQG